MQIRDIFYGLEKISDKWDPYFDVYERHLSKFCGQSPRVLEIGVQNGGSIDMWHKYFGEGAQIVGIDIDPKCLQLQYDFPAEILIGDQADPKFWDSFFKTHDTFDVVIEDGGHTMQQQLVTLEKVWSKLNVGGVYICEDTHTSYMEGWGGRMNNPGTFLHFAKHLTDVLNTEHISPGFISKKTEKLYREEMYSISFYNSMVVFEKQQLKPFTRVFSHDKRAV